MGNLWKWVNHRGWFAHAQNRKPPVPGTHRLRSAVGKFWSVLHKTEIHQTSNQIMGKQHLKDNTFWICLGSYPHIFLQKPTWNLKISLLKKENSLTNPSFWAHVGLPYWFRYIIKSSIYRGLAYRPLHLQSLFGWSLELPANSEYTWQP